MARFTKIGTPNTRHTPRYGPAIGAAMRRGTRKFGVPNTRGPKINIGRVTKRGTPNTR